MTTSPQVLAIVPLRLRSTRLKEKILAPLASGKKSQALCVLVCERVLKAFTDFSAVQVLAAVDDPRTERILKNALPQLTVIMTSPELPSGTDRVFAAAQSYLAAHPAAAASLKGVLNIQGDMPFLSPGGLRDLAQFFLGASEGDLQRAPVVTLCQDWPRDRTSPRLSASSAVKVILNRDSYALYFSRYPIPYSRNSEGRGAPADLAKFHLGVYGYEKNALARFCAAPPAGLEQAEGLEQLRALYLGMPILVLPTAAAPGESYRGIDTPADLKWARAFGRAKPSRPKARASAQKYRRPQTRKGKKS